MTETVYETSDPLFVGLLNIACSNPAYVEMWDKTFGKESEKGYSTYRVVTHCTAVTYTAMVIDRDHNGWPTRYRVIHRDYEAC